jgi:hypothetical protein
MRPATTIAPTTPIRHITQYTTGVGGIGDGVGTIPTAATGSTASAKKIFAADPGSAAIFFFIHRTGNFAWRKKFSKIAFSGMVSRSHAYNGVTVSRAGG